MSDRQTKLRSFYLEGLAEIDAAYCHVRVALPRAHYRLERMDLRIWAGLVAI